MNPDKDPSQRKPFIGAENRNISNSSNTFNGEIYKKKYKSCELPPPIIEDQIDYWWVLECRSAIEHFRRFILCN